MTETKELKLPSEKSAGVLKALLLLAIPIVIGNLLESVTEIVDMHFIGTLGQTTVAGASAATSVTALMLTLLMGISIAVTAFVANTLGKGDKESIPRILSHIAIFSLILYVIIVIINVFFCDQIMLIVTHGNEVTAAIGASYLHPMLFGMIFLIGLLYATAAFQAIGKAYIPMILLVGVNIVNAVLNPILINACGLPGSAYATIIARGLGCIVLLILMYTLRCAKENNLRLLIPPKFSGKLFKHVLAVGVPSSIQGCLRNFGLLIMTSIVAVYGTAALAAYGICTRTDIIGLMIGMGVAQAVCVMVGQSLGSGNIVRAKRTVKFAVLLNFIIMGIIAIIFITAAPAILSFFGATGESLSIGLIWMSFIPIVSIFMGVAFAFGFAMNGAGVTWPGMVGVIAGQIVIPVGVALLAAANGLPIVVVFIGVGAGIMVNFLLDFVFYMSGIWKKFALTKDTA